MKDRIWVTAESSDQEIIAAINKAGDARHYWRKHDWPAPNSNNTRSWVKPGDIGPSHRDDTRLLRRLRSMVKAGILEERCHRYRSMPINNYPCATTYRSCRGFPRFRVILTDDI